jgi:predicted RNA-binding Zn-ribbon protein involved in translation (DUF1610 family)
MWSGVRSVSGTIAKFFLREQDPYCASCGRKMSPTQIEPLLTTRVDVVTFTCKACGAGEKRARRRAAKSAAQRR